EGEDARLRKIVREEPRGLAAECPELEDRLALEDRCERAQDQWAKTSDRSVHPDGLDAAEAGEVDGFDVLGGGARERGPDHLQQSAAKLWIAERSAAR